MFETKKSTLFESAWDTSLSGTGKAMDSLGGSYRTMSDTMELICQTFDRKRRKLKVFFFITWLLLQYMAIQNCQCLELLEVWEGQ